MYATACTLFLSLTHTHTHTRTHTHLKVLVMTYNEIQRLEGLGDLTALTRLDMSHNLVKKVCAGRWVSTFACPAVCHFPSRVVHV